MNVKERARFDHGRKRQAYFLHLSAGLRSLFFLHRWQLAIVAAYLLAVFWGWWCARKWLLLDFPNMSPLFSALVLILDGLIILLCILGLGLLVLAFGTPFKAKAYQDNLLKAGFVNYINDPPLFLARYKKEGCTFLEFDMNTLPISQWQDSTNEIGAALNCVVVTIKQSADGKRAIIKAAPMRSTLSDKVYWREEYLSPNNFELILGEGLAGKEKFNLAASPHLLIGGGTGSGKSILVKCLLMQSIKKGACVIIADFKGGVDYTPVWHKRCQMIFEPQELLNILERLTQELERRRELFVTAGTPNLAEYNKATGESLSRYIFACDEVAEILDTTGLDKGEKAIFPQIVRHLSLIARQGRAFGIHLILSTQRPSADLIPGQIRTNLTLRICGRADDILSRIILDSPAAAEQIPLDAKGRFITNMGQVFQGYLFDDSILES